MPDFVSDLVAAVDKLGVEPAGLVWGIAQTNWESAEQRDAFLDEITKQR